MADPAARESQGPGRALSEGAAQQVKWWHGWLPVVLGPGVVVLSVPPTWPRWAFMWILAFAIFCGCKWVTWRRSSVRGTACWRHVAYLLGWPGLDAESFLDPALSSPPSAPTQREWTLAAGKTAVGVGLLYGLARRVAEASFYWSGWVGMVGLVMVLHFGLFHLLSCVWRRFGVEARPLMNAPLRSTSLSEFWGRRWNTAFRDLTHRFLFRPLRAALGARGAIFAGFLFSGLVHDAVISMPAGGGYGGPTLFFLLQALGMLVERSQFGRWIGLARGARGWLFTMAMLIVPVGWLFHVPFVLNIIVPFMRALGAL